MIWVGAQVVSVARARVCFCGGGGHHRNFADLVTRIYIFGKLLDFY